jgi:hypothetical protein
MRLCPYCEQQHIIGLSDDWWATCGDDACEEQASSDIGPSADWCATCGDDACEEQASSDRYTTERSYREIRGLE